MNKSAIKGFSVRARRKLIEDISQKAYALGIKGTGKYDDTEEFEGGFRVKNAVNQIIYPLSTKKDREKLIAEINRKGFEQVVEEVAYTWFNRIIAIRFMEINEYLPIKVRVLSSEVEGKTEPDVITHIYDYVSDLELDGEKVFNLKENHKDEELFKYVFVKECNNLGKLMPQVFEAIGDYTELLLPDQLLSSGSVVRDLVESIDEEDFKEEVEIIGWMYQYYISEKKDEVFAALKKNKKITKENIPAATQLFTPKWIVKYMTENSLGRLWQESHPDEALKHKWEYYIEPAEQEPEVQMKLNELKNPNLSPEEIKILDPAMGSGHILVYAFDVLYDIYLSRGYAERDIPQLILEKNLYGLDIDDRAAQLATFALLMKARSKNRRFFKELVELNICSIQESNGFSMEALEYLVSPDETQNEKVAHLTGARYLIDVFKDAKEFGSILKINKIDFDVLQSRIFEIAESTDFNMFQYGYKLETMNVIPKLIKQAQIMSRSYDVVITNPPYMTIKNGTSKLSEFVSEYYTKSKTDLYSVFIDKVKDYTKNNGYFSMITQLSWMYLYSFENLRYDLINNVLFDSLIHLGSNSFEDISGEVVQSTSFVFKKNAISKYKPLFIDLTTMSSSSAKEKLFLSMSEITIYKGLFQEDFLNIPNYSLSYRLNEKGLDIYTNGNIIENIFDVRRGPSVKSISSSVKKWYEIKTEDIGENKEWRFVQRSGSKTKWKSICDEIIRFSDLKGTSNYDYQTLECLYWPDARFGSTSISAGIKFSNQAFESGVNVISTSNRDELKQLLAHFNSFLYEEMLSNIVNGQHFSPIYIKKLPYLKEINSNLLFNVDEIINIIEKFEKHMETSSEFVGFWGLKDGYSSVEDLVKDFLTAASTAVERIRDLEQKNDDILSSLYHIEKSNVLKYNSEIILGNDSQQSIVKDLISYVIGCILGRYELETKNKTYKQELLIFTEKTYFDNDIVKSFNYVIGILFGVENLDKNIEYIVSILYPGSKEKTKMSLYKYFAKDFYKDHLKKYNNRPIYWMLSSGKSNGIKALFYYHNYDVNILSKFRTDYLHEIQRIYQGEIELLEKLENNINLKELITLKKKYYELSEYDSIIAYLANKRISLNFNEGIIKNYSKFQKISIFRDSEVLNEFGNALEKI